MINAAEMHREIRVVCFTEDGRNCANRIFREWAEYSPKYREPGESLSAWTEDAFRERTPIVFISACGIAVRAVAPCVRDKMTDSPVIVIDEKGQYVIPILSGHVGGANELANRIAERIGAIPVITTATDVHGVFAADVFARKNGLQIVNRNRIRAVSAKLLSGDRIRVSCTCEDAIIDGKQPEQIGMISPDRQGIEAMYYDPHDSFPQYPNVQYPDIWIKDPEQDLQRQHAGTKNSNPQCFDAQCPAIRRPDAQHPELRHPDTQHPNLRRSDAQHPDLQLPDTQWLEAQRMPLVLTPKRLILGIGCRRGKSAEEIRNFIHEYYDEARLEADLYALASVSLKQNEEGLLRLARYYRVPFLIFTPEELEKVPGDFAESEFVRSRTGTGNVCERAAAAASGRGTSGALILRKQTRNGMTLAAARRSPVRIDWNAT